MEEKKEVEGVSEKEGGVVKWKKEKKLRKGEKEVGKVKKRGGKERDSRKEKKEMYSDV
ncbi:hypothetical protein ACFPC0_27790 [Streptomyces andamanensis]|uniref:Uncharacterized protein n=1 Tax=Streptomyces andamanensis TaxID=1565035 RepID=A0ABV8TLC9_9ACTN